MGRESQAGGAGVRSTATGCRSTNDGTRHPRPGDRRRVRPARSRGGGTVSAARRGGVWTEERSDEGRRRISAPRGANRRCSDEGRRREQHREASGRGSAAPQEVRVKKLLYRPVGLLAGAGAGLIAGFVFKKIWGLASDGDAPDALDEDRNWSEILPAAALQGAIFATVKT